MGQEELDDITKEKERALSIENKVDRFMALSEVINLTESSGLPDGVKERVVRNLQEHQLIAVDLL